MNAATKTIPLSIEPGGIEPIINVSQYDSGVRKINFDLTDYSLPSDATVRVRGSKPDGKGFVYTTYTGPGDRVSIFVEDQMTACAGLVRCELEIRSNDSPSDVIHTARFTLKVDKSPLDDTTVISDSELSLLETAGNSARAAAESASAAKASADSASGSEANAAASASAASSSAKAIASSASEAASSATAAKTSETNASTFASTASSAASAAGESQTAAANSASSAAQSATNASGSATSAANSASDATKSASEAKASADAAAESAKQASTSKYSVFTGATAFVDGSTGLVPAPSTVDVNSYLCGDGTWKAVSGGTGTSDNPVKVDVILTAAVTSGTVTVYRIGHLLHIFGNDISVNSPATTIFSLQNKQIGFKIGNSASLWISSRNFTDSGIVIVGPSENLSSAVDCALLGNDSGTDIYFSLTVPLFDS